MALPAVLLTPGAALGADASASFLGSSPTGAGRRATSELFSDPVRAVLSYSPLEELGASFQKSGSVRTPPSTAVETAPIEETEASPSGASATTTIELQSRYQLETPRGYAQAALLPSAGPEAFVRVHGLGAVYAMADSERTLWNRPSSSLYADWGVTSSKPPAVLIGSSPTSPLAYVTEHPFAVGDFNGDGTDDVAVAHVVPVKHPFDPFEWDTFLTILDGRDGATLWWERYDDPAYVMQLVAADLDLTPGAELVVAREPSSGTSTLVALDFEGPALEPAELWSFDTNRSGAAFIHADLVGDDPPRIAASWSATTFGGPAPKGEVILVDGTTGDVVWRLSTTGYVRTFRADPTAGPAGSIVVQEMADPWGDPILRNAYIDISYTLRSLSLKDGSVLATAVRAEALMLDLEIGNADTDALTEWVVSDLTRRGKGDGGIDLGYLDSDWASTRVTLFEPTGFPRWTYEVPKLELEMPTGLAIVPGPQPLVVVAESKGRARGFPPDESIGHIFWDRQLFALTGPGNSSPPTTIWRLQDEEIQPSFVLQPHVQGKSALLFGTLGLGARAYDPATGARVDTVRVLAEPTTILARDLNGDGTKDLIVGAQSGIVAALDGNGLHPTMPRALWTAAFDGPVHEVALGDLDGDGVEEAVVAASTQVAAVRLADGEILWSRSKPAGRLDELFWTVAVGDLDGDGADDVVVPCERLLALKGSTGATLWEYEPPDGGDPLNFSSVGLVDADGDGAADVGAEYTALDPPKTLVPGQLVGLVTVSGKTGLPFWERLQPNLRGQAYLWRSVAAYQGPSGPRVAFTIGDAGTQVIGTRRVRIDVYDARTGELAWTSGRRPKGSGPMLTMHSPAGGDEVLTFNWEGATRTRPTETVDVELANVWDAAFGSLLPGEQHLVLGTIEADRPPILVYPACAVLESCAPDLLGQWGDLSRLFGSQTVEVIDLDDDGIDEIIGMPFDLPAWWEVIYYQGESNLTADPTRHGLEILEAVPA